MRVLGVDPGTAVTGWGVLDRRGATIVHVGHGTITTHADAALPTRLAVIHRALLDGCDEWRPDVIALEKSFVGRNVQSAFRLGEVRGVALLVAALRGLATAEYSPAAIKLAVTGSGRADKTQIQRAVARELRLDDAMPADAADALAIALCHVYADPLRALIATATRRAGHAGVRA